MWWSLVFGALTTAGLGVLAWALLVLHALGYGAVVVIAPGTDVAAPDGGRYASAFAVGVIVHAAIATAALRLGSRTAIGTWPPMAQGLGTALVAAPVACPGRRRSCADGSRWS